MAGEIDGLNGNEVGADDGENEEAIDGTREGEIVVKILGN